MKEKAKQSVDQTKRILKNLDEFLSALALTVTTGFAGYQAYEHRQDGIMYAALGVAVFYAAFQAFRAWLKALNK
jgi:hypothetical protein